MILLKTWLLWFFCDSDLEPNCEAVDADLEPNFGAVDADLEPNCGAVDADLEPNCGAGDAYLEPNCGAGDTELEPIVEPMDPKCGAININLKTQFEVVAFWNVLKVEPLPPFWSKISWEITSFLRF